jgi:type I restriction-modification system DNA methylase subunit
MKHPDAGGDCLEENEIVAHFPGIGLGQEKPDFLFCFRGEPCVVIEAKNERGKVDEAIKEAIDYADMINDQKKHTVLVAVGAAGEEDCGFTVEVRFKKGNKWLPLTSGGYEITTVPSKREVDLALLANDATTQVTVPTSYEFIDSAIELSRLLRFSKVEAPLRPKVIGAIVLALYQEDLSGLETDPLESINTAVTKAIDEAVDLVPDKKIKLKEALHLTGSDYERLAQSLARIVALLRRLNIRAVLQTDTDFLGLFYEAFLRYGYDNNALGIVFTPRHITRFAVELTGISATDRVIDIASGTGGFLVAAFDAMMLLAHGPKAIQKVKQSLYGFDTNPTIWALATLNMFFRGDGKSHIENDSCLDAANRKTVEGNFTRAYLNPPFSQEGEPERDFITAAMEALEPEGVLAVVVKAGIFADEDNLAWRREFTRKHTVLGTISLPDDLFYPTASAPTTLLVAKAHMPQLDEADVFVAKVWNDGFEKLKSRRVECKGSQMPDIAKAFNEFLHGRSVGSPLAKLIKGRNIVGGAEWSPHQYLPQPMTSQSAINAEMHNVNMSLYQSVAAMVPLADEVLDDFAESWSGLPEIGTSKPREVSYFFNVLNGKSSGEKNYLDGDCPYISSGDSSNSIIRLINEVPDETFEAGGITVTAFGQAYIQPWRFMARGNGGSAVRVLIPKFKMTLRDLFWFASQINLQRWRFFYGRMAIKSRLEKLVVSPPRGLSPAKLQIRQSLVDFRDNLEEVSSL